MSEIITFEELGVGYLVYAESGGIKQCIGEITGPNKPNSNRIFWAYRTVNMNWGSAQLRAIADKLDQLNGVASIPQRATPSSVRQIEAQVKQVESELNGVEKQT